MTAGHVARSQLIYINWPQALHGYFLIDDGVTPGASGMSHKFALLGMSVDRGKGREGV